MSYSLSQLDAIGDVDPVAEADVYLAYGRDLQAEEILKEAMRSNPERLAIRTKLLEVYAKRRDTKGFELLATQLLRADRAARARSGPRRRNWAADRPGQPAVPAGRPAARRVRGDGGRIVEPLGASTMPQSVMPAHVAVRLDARRSTRRRPATDSRSPRRISTSTSTSARCRRAVAADAPPTSRRSTGIDSPTERDVLDAADARSQPTHGLDCCPMRRSTRRRQAAPRRAPATDRARRFDLLGIIARPRARTAPARPRLRRSSDSTMPSSSRRDDGDDPLARKLELAEEFQRRSATWTARATCCEEVLAKAGGALKTKAQSMLDRPGLSARAAARRESVADAARARRQLPRQRLPGLAEPARRQHRAGPARSARCRRFADRAGRAPSAPAAPMPACTRSTRWCTSTPPVERDAVLVGARHQPLPAGRHRGAVVRSRCPTTSTARASARGRRYPTCCSSRRCGRRSRPAASAGCSGRSTATRCAPRRARLLGEHDFSAFRSAECQAPIAGEDAARDRRSSGAAPTGASTSTPSAFLHHMVRNIMGCLVAVGSGSAAAGLDGARCWRRATATLAAPTFAADGLYFVGPYYDAAMAASRAHAARMRLAALSDADAVHSAPASRSAASRASRRRRRGRRRRRRGRLRVLRREPALRRRCERAAELARRAAAVRDAGAAVRQRRARPTIAAALDAMPARSCCSSTATRRRPSATRRGRPYLRAARMAPGFDLLDFARRFRERRRPAARRPCRGLSAAAERSSIGRSFPPACPLRSFCLVGCMPQT